MGDLTSVECVAVLRPKRVKPSWRGISHQYAFFVSLIAGPVLLSTACTPRALTAGAIYAVSLSALLGVSALYHRVTWSPRSRYWMARLDLAMIFLLIAGSYTPIAMLVVTPPFGTTILWGIWGSAVAGILLKLLWDPTKLATSVVYVVMGSTGAFAVPDINSALGPVAVWWLLAGGVLYIVGAVIYALERPDPLPAVFGYHEIFHALVIVAAATHYVAMAAYILPGRL